MFVVDFFFYSGDFLIVWTLLICFDANIIVPLIIPLLSSLYFRSADNDDATKRKVNLVFEKIQTLKSRAAGKTQVNFILFSASTLKACQ